MAEIVCVDNHILIWGIEQKARPSQQEMILKTRFFIDNLLKNNVKVIVPAVVLSEFLMPIPAEKVVHYVDIISRNLMIIPYDAVASIKFAEIWQSKTKQEVIEKIREEGFGKNYLKIDCMIVATAVVRKATCIYSHDDGLKKFAEGYIEVREVPDLPSEVSDSLLQQSLAFKLNQ